MGYVQSTVWIAELGDGKYRVMRDRRITRGAKGGEATMRNLNRPRTVFAVVFVPIDTASDGLTCDEVGTKAIAYRPDFVSNVTIQQGKRLPS